MGSSAPTCELALLLMGKCRRSTGLGCRRGRAQEPQERLLGRGEQMVRRVLQDMASLRGERQVCCQWKTWTVLLFCLFSGRPACFHPSSWKSDIGRKSFLMIRAGAYAACSPCGSKQEAFAGSIPFYVRIAALPCLTLQRCVLA